MDLSMSSSSISALGLLTNTEPLRLIPELKGADKDPIPKEKKKDEVKLIFLGTFFHDSNELNADLVQIKEPTQIKEVRVIPLGATVNLSTGSYQLGATNPSELELEFYYNDLQVPSKSAFTLLRNFSFNDKCRIQLTVEPDDQIITDGLIVRGIYSTITLAVYGYRVEEVPVKLQGSDRPITDTGKENTVVEAVAEDLTTSPVKVDSPKKQVDVGPSSDNVLVSPNSIDGRSDSLQSKAADPGATPIGDSKRGNDSDEPQAIPTITTRLKFDSPFSTTREDKGTEEPIDRDRITVESDLSSDDQFESTSESLVKPLVKPIATVPVVFPDLEDAEDISDGEVFPEEDEIEIEEKDAESTIISSAGKASPQGRDSRTGSPAIEPLSDQEDSLMDEFTEPGVEEIISDEEMPDFPEYEYGELDEQWAQLFGSSFNPFSENFRVLPLKNFKVAQSLGPVTKTNNDMVSFLESKAKEWSKDNFNTEKIESWVQDMEELIPMIPRICSPENVITEAVKESLLYWTTVGIDLSLAKRQAQLPFKTRHIKVGIRLLHALSISDESIMETLLCYKIDEEILDGGQTVQQKLIEIFEEQYMSTSMRLSILRALDCMILTKAGFRAFVGDEDNEDENTCYARLLEFTLDKNVGTRVSFSIRSFLNKVKLLEDLNAFEDFVLGIVKNSSSELSTSVEAQDVDDCVHILETLRDMAKKVDQYLSHPLRILPAGSSVELPSASVTGHDPKISFIKALEQYKFIKLSTVLVNNKDLYGRTGGLVSEIISILLEWEAGLVYLCSEGESTTILLKTLAQLEDDGANTALYACHCLEVIKCIDKLTDSEILESLRAGERKMATVEEDKNEDIGCLQTLMSFLSTPLGRLCLSATLTIGDLIVPLLNCLKPAEGGPLTESGKDKYVRKGYASRIVAFIVRNGENNSFLMKHGGKIHEIISGMEEDVEGLTGNLSSVLPFLRLTQEPIMFSLEGIEELFRLVKSNQDALLRAKNNRNNWGYPPELTTAMRLLCGLVVPSTLDDVKNCIAADVDDMLIKELKYDVALVRLHSFDAVSTFLSIIQKIIDDFNGQPATQSWALVSEKGDALINLLSPMVKMIRRTISQVVQVRKTDFKDTTAVPVLLRLYSIVDCVPISAPCHRRSREVGQNIIGTLLAYTIPALKQGVETEEELNRSAWTAVMSEIMTYTMEEPATFITGVGIFSELLPLPLPIASKIPLTAAECDENFKLRRLWSAYIHGLSSQIQEMIGVLCTSANTKLITLLKRLCVQLADLSGSTCMVVCRAILDAIFFSIENDMEAQQQGTTDLVPYVPGISNNTAQVSSIRAWLDQSKSPKLLLCSANTARLLGFLSSLINNSGTVKSGIMQALRGVLKLDEKYTDLITQLCCMVINNNGQQQSSSSHVQAQENIVTIFQSLCDQEINVIVPMYGYSGKIYDSKFVLANSLPPKDLFITICNTLMNYVAVTPYKFSESRVMESVLRGLEIIAETEYGFYHMRSCIDKTSGIFKNILITLSAIDLTKQETFEAAWSCISSTVELLRSLTSPRHGTGSNVTNRASVLTKQEFKTAVDWPGVYKKEEEEAAEDDSEPLEDDDSQRVPTSNPAHPLNQVLKLVQKQLLSLSTPGPSSQRSQVTVEVTEVESTICMLASVLEFLEEEKESFETTPETVLPLPDLLQELFNKRPVFVIVEKLGSETLPPFWLTSIPPAFDLDSEYSESDLVAYDLNELCQSQFVDLDIVKEVEKYFKSSDGATSTDKEDATPDRPKIKMPGDNQGMILSPLTSHRKPFGSHLRGGMRGGFGRGLSSGSGRGLDPFRSRPPNTSRPPSLHVDDFVALESSGQSGSVAAAYNKGGMRTDNFNSRGGRGNSRGSLLGRPYNDRGRFRSLQSGNSYFGNRLEGQQSSMRRGSRGAGKGYGGDQRWSSSGEGRDSSSYGRSEHSGGRSMYEDKFRSSPMRSQGSSGPRNRNQPYPSRNPYREAPPMGRNNTSANNNNPNSAPRWRDRQRPFNR